MKLKMLALLASCVAASALAAPLPILPPLPPAFALPPLSTNTKTFGAGLPLLEFLRIQFSVALRKPFVVTPAVPADLLLSADLSGVPVKDLLPVLREVLGALGLAITESRGVYIIDKKPPETLKKSETEEAKQLLVYAPRHRSVGELSSYFPLFPRLQFAYGAGIARPALAPAMPSSGAASGGSLGADFSTGATAFSQTTGDPGRLVVRGEDAALGAFSSFLASVDIPLQQVLVRVYVLEVRDAQTKAGGVSLALSILNDKFRLNLGSAPAGGDSLKLSSSLGSISAVVGALSGDSRVRLITSPVLRAKDGASVSATIGTETPTLGGIVTQGTSSTQSVTYQSAGVLLSVSPRVFADSIQVKISQEVSSFVATETGLTGTPTKLRRSFVSDLVTQSGDVLLLGGLSEAKASSSNSRSAFFFGSDAQESSSSDIVVLFSVEKS